MAEEGDPIRRLGTRDLGRYAFEERMPLQLQDLAVKEDTTNAVSGVIENLARLLRGDRRVETALLCTNDAVQIHKLSEEGPHFCGYRNIQVLWSALGHPYAKHLPFVENPTISQLQDMIEAAWDAGYNSHGRQLTGGIRGTRKHIGTSEVEALLLSLKIPCVGTHLEGKSAYADLLKLVEAYYAGSQSVHAIGVHQTNRPPIFLQRPSHSLTIIGIERSRNGQTRLLAFDPAWRPPSSIRSPLSDAQCSGWQATWTLKQYRKSERSLRRFAKFETLTVPAES